MTKKELSDSDKRLLRKDIRYQYYHNLVYEAPITRAVFGKNPQACKFDYQISVKENNRLKKKHNFSANTCIYSNIESNQLRVAAFGDHYFDRDLAIHPLAEGLVQKEYDLLLVLGDISYELFHFYGANGDDYFDKMQKVFTRTPVFMVAGNHDLTDYGRLLAHRLRPHVVDSSIEQV